MERPPDHPGTLRFRSPELEEAFRLDNTGRMARYVRWPLLLGGVLFAAYGFIDQAVAPQYAATMWIARLVTVALVVLVAWRMSGRVRRGELEALFSLVALAAGAVLAVETWFWADAGRLTAHTGVIILLIYIHVLSRMPFLLVTALGWTISAAYMSVLAAHPAATQADLLEHGAALASANLTGMVASYVLERYARRVFYQARTVEESRSALERQAKTLTETNEYLANAVRELQEAQDRLVQQEKMASLGRLTAGVAHEIKNPLNFINNFAGLNAELLVELRTVLGTEGEGEDASALLSQLETNADRIESHGRRADGIVRSMLAHARSGGGVRVTADLNALVSEHLDLAYHAFRAGSPEVHPTVERDFDPEAGSASVNPQEIGRVIINLTANAFQAAADRAARGEAGYTPCVRVATRRRGPEVQISVSDNGVGVAPAVRGRLFEPFFTTRPAGEGTGLGLSLSYEIVAGHGGTIEVESPPGEGATFVVKLPVGGDG